MSVPECADRGGFFFDLKVPSEYCFAAESRGPYGVALVGHFNSGCVYRIWKGDCIAVSMFGVRLSILQINAASRNRKLYSPPFVLNRLCTYIPTQTLLQSVRGRVKALHVPCLV